LNKRAFDIPNCKIHEWRNGKERKGRLGRGRILWIKARTLSGKTINIVNVYQATADKPEMQKRMYEALTRALNSEHDPCILVGDFNTSIEEGRTNYAQPNPSNTTTMTDAAFADFVEKTKGKIVPPTQSSWRNPFGGIRSQEAKLDFAITYNFEGAEVEG
jgi:endonuclease/exonuclease/phosphatase family metal-dependent hydrolase